MPPRQGPYTVRFRDRLRAPLECSPPQGTPPGRETPQPQDPRKERTRQYSQASLEQKAIPSIVGGGIMDQYLLQMALVFSDNRSRAIEGVPRCRCGH
jgi:hypothetical protein